jgi:hypothetical protein
MHKVLAFLRSSVTFVDITLNTPVSDVAIAQTGGAPAPHIFDTKWKLRWIDDTDI